MAASFLPAEAKSIRLERTALRTCHATVMMFQRADSPRCRASSMRLPRLPAVSNGTSRLKNGIHGFTPEGATPAQGYHTITLTMTYTDESAPPDRRDDPDHPARLRGNAPLRAGRYEYKLLLNGNRWLDDPGNPRKAPDGLGGFDLYISYYRNGQWTKAKNLGAPINSAADDLSPKITPDGKYFFWASTRSDFSLTPDQPRTTTDFFRKLAGPRNGLGDIYYIVRLRVTPDV